MNAALTAFADSMSKEAAWYDPRDWYAGTAMGNPTPGKTGKVFDAGKSDLLTKLEKGNRTESQYQQDTSKAKTVGDLTDSAGKWNLGNAREEGKNYTGTVGKIQSTPEVQKANKEMKSKNISN